MDLIGPHKLSDNHRAALTKSTKAGCFYCQATFAPSEVVEWIDRGTTALCPRCGIDSVIGDADHPLDRGFLASMHAYWFSSRPPTSSE